ncbi:MAG: BadF/BadG/BcrA/BcrD ATPase family protein [Microthrixaceae bacterium]
MSLFVGVDLGGTSARAALGRPSPAAPPATITSGEADDPLDVLHRGLKLANAVGAEVTALVAGCAGAGREPVRRRCRAIFAGALPNAAVSVVPDYVLPLAAAGLDTGIVLIAGTGAVAAGIPASADASALRVDGWGPTLGDRGSAYDLGRRALVAGLDALDGRGPQTALVGALAAELGLRDLTAVVDAIADPAPLRRRIAALAPRVCTLAETDAVAAELLARCSAELVKSAAAVRRRWGPTCPDNVALSGGLLVGSPRYRTMVTDGLAAVGIEADAISLVREPALGAYEMAQGLIR